MTLTNADYDKLTEWRDAFEREALDESQRREFETLRQNEDAGLYCDLLEAEDTLRSFSDDLGKFKQALLREEAQRERGGSFLSLTEAQSVEVTDSVNRFNAACRRIKELVAEISQVMTQPHAQHEGRDEPV
jgi:hypothetical protein